MAKRRRVRRARKELLTRAVLIRRISSRQRGPVDTSRGWQSTRVGWRDQAATEFRIFRTTAMAFRPGDPALNDRSWKRVMWVWGRRVRRDFLALEEQFIELATREGYRRPFLFHDPGDPPPPPDERGGFH